jgi:hypothetical protein
MVLLTITLEVVVNNHLNPPPPPLIHGGQGAGREGSIGYVTSFTQIPHQKTQVTPTIPP